MKILDDLISGLDKETSIKEIRQGPFYTGVLSRNCGLAATLVLDAFKQDRPWAKEPGLLLDKSIDALLHMAYSDRILEAAIGVATINSLIDIDDQKHESIDAGQLIAEKGREKRVAIVGHFPFTQMLREVAGQLWIIEKNPEEGDYPESEADTILPQADIVGITGTSLINHTIEKLLKLCHPEAYVIVLGATTPLSPVLFDHNIDAVAGTKVINSELALRCVSQGATYRYIKGIQKVVMRRP